MLASLLVGSMAWTGAFEDIARFSIAGEDLIAAALLHDQHLVGPCQTGLKGAKGGNLVLTLEEAWTGRGRMVLCLQGDAHTASHEIDVIEGRIQLDAPLLPGFYQGELALFGAGTLRGKSVDEDLLLPFDAHVKAGETAERRVGVH